MAGGKETPRQKLIGMMYLVLMAMLALNVSVTVLDAFVVVDEGLTKTTENFSQQMLAHTGNLQNDLPKILSVSGPGRKKPMPSKRGQTSYYDYIQELKQEMVIVAEGEDSPAIAEDGRIIGAAIKGKESTNPPASGHAD
jgi:hypothetical protein